MSLYTTDPYSLFVGVVVGNLLPGKILSRYSKNLSLVHLYLLSNIFLCTILYIVYKIALVMNIEQTLCFDLDYLGFLIDHYRFDSSFIDGGNRSTQGKPPTCRKSLTNFIT